MNKTESSAAGDHYEVIVELVSKYLSTNGIYEKPGEKASEYLPAESQCHKFNLRYDRI